MTGKLLLIFRKSVYRELRSKWEANKTVERVDVACSFKTLGCEWDCWFLLLFVCFTWEIDHLIKR